MEQVHTEWRVLDAKTEQCWEFAPLSFHFHAKEYLPAQYTERIEKFYGFIYKSKPFKTRRHSQVINGRNVSSTYSLRRLCTFVLFKCFACPSTQPNSFLRNWWLRLCVMIGLPFSLIRLNPSCVFRRLPTIPRLPPCLGYDVNRDRNRNITQLCNLL